MTTVKTGDFVSPLRDLKPHVFMNASYRVLSTKFVRRGVEKELFMKLEVRHLCQCVNAWWPFAYFRRRENEDPRMGVQGSRVANRV